MKATLLIAKSTFQETVRDRIYSVLLIFGFIFLAATIFLGSLSLGENAVIMKDFGLAGIYIFTLITAIFSGVNVVSREIERGTSRVVLSKPISQTKFVAGKFLGLWLSTILVIIAMTALFSIILAAKGIFFTTILWPNFLLFFEIGVVIALSIFFAALSSPFAGTMYTILFVFISHSLPTLKIAADRSGKLWSYLGSAIYYLLPNLEKFNLRNTVSVSWQPTPAQIFLPVLYAAIEVIILLWLATLLLKQREE